MCCLPRLDRPLPDFRVSPFGPRSARMPCFPRLDRPSVIDLGGLLSLLGQSGAWKSKSAKIDLNLLNFTVFCLLGPSQGVLLELSWGFLGASWAVLRPSWAILERD